MAVMPMFPLGATLLPGALLPLHVFEPRYRQLVQDLLADDDHPPEFGVTMIERGREVGGGDDRSMVGTIARVVDMQVTPDGRYAVASVGTERFRVREWLADDPYPRADVERWPDEGDAPADAAARVAALHDRLREVNGVAGELGEAVPDPDTEISPDPALASFHLASLAPIGPVDRHRILAAPGLADRLDVLAEALDDAMAVLVFRRS
jgi:Lon protease-like protein